MLAAVIVGGALVFTGVISMSTALYAGLVGGMFLMHLGGGHGGHCTAGHESHSSPAEGATDLSRPSSGIQPSAPGSTAGLDHRAGNTRVQTEIRDNDQHSSHGCH